MVATEYDKEMKVKVVKCFILDRADLFRKTKSVLFFNVK